jgi:hypothetical protein
VDDITIERPDFSPDGPYARLFCNHDGIRKLLYGVHAWALWITEWHPADQELYQGWDWMATLLIFAFRGAALWQSTIATATPTSPRSNTNATPTRTPSVEDDQTTPRPRALPSSIFPPAPPPTLAPVFTLTSTTSAPAHKVKAHPPSPSPKQSGPVSSQLTNVTEANGERIVPPPIIIGDSSSGSSSLAMQDPSKPLPSRTTRSGKAGRVVAQSKAKGKKGQGSKQ